MQSTLVIKLWGLSFSLSVILSVIHFPEYGYAQYLTGPVASGSGGASRVGVEDGEQILHNPAALTHSSEMASSIFYADGYRDKDEHDKWWGATITDNTKDVFAAGGFAYAKRRRTFARWNSRDEQFFQFSAARTVWEYLSVGLSAHYIEADVKGDKKYHLWNGDIGFHFNPAPDLGFGLVFYNVAPDASGTPRELLEGDKISGGVQYIFYEIFQLRIDLSQVQSFNPHDRWHWQAGLETKTSELFKIRMGLQRDALGDRSALSAGMTFDGPRLKLDYFYEKNIDYSGGALHGVDIRLPFW